MRPHSYQHTQIGWTMLLCVGLGGLVVFGAVAGLPAPQHALRHAVFLPPAIVLSLIVLLFPSLTVQGNDDGLRVRFGLGPIARRFEWRDIRSSRVVRNSWLNGFGIRKVAGGWMFNVSGLDAVELELASGRVFRIGTDDPHGLHGYVETMLRHHPR
jgi:hypothetical protein